MEFFQRAKVFRIKCSHQSKYLIADQDEETVKLSRESSSPYARWSYDLVEGKTNIIRLRSCHSWKYLAASEEHFLLGMTGKRVAQRPYLGSTVEWEPIKEGPYIKLKSHCGTFLRGNRGPPPWRNTITHDVPGHWTASESMTLWIVDVIEVDRKSSNGGVSKSNAPVSLSTSSTGDHKYFSSNSSLSIDDDGSVENVPSLEHSASFSKLKSMLDSLDEIHDGAEGEERLNTEQVLPSGVKEANRILKELLDLDFHFILSSGRYTELENALNVLANAAKTSKRGENLSDCVNILKQLKAMKNDHDSATQDLSDYAAFDTVRLKIKAEIDKDVAKASLLEATLETWYSKNSVNDAVEKEELEKQLEATESSIKAVEVLKTRIETKNEELMEMEDMEISWQAKKVEAERSLLRIENGWVKVKNLLTNILLN